MRLLYISNGYPPHRWAGTETYTAGIAQKFRERNHEVKVICIGEWSSGSSYWNGYTDKIHKGVSVRRINLNWKKAPDPNRYLYNNPVVAEYLSGYIDEIKPELVHVTSCETLSASVLEIVKNAHIPLVLSLTDFWFLCPRINLLRSDGDNCDGITTPWECLNCKLDGSSVHRRVMNMLPEDGANLLFQQISKFRLITRQRGLRGMALDMADRKRYLCEAITWPDYRITASPFVREIFIKNGVTAQINVQPYGHELSWLEKYKGKRPSQKIRIGFIGQIIKSKGVHLLLESARAVQKIAGDRVNFYIYGKLHKNSRYCDELVELARDLDNIEFLGTYQRKQSSDVYSDIDVLVVPSLWHDFPLVIHEAFTTNTPVIATNLGGMAEAVEHEVSGLLFERGNVDDLTRQMLRVVEEPNLYSRLVSGIPKVKKIDEEVLELEQIYTRLIN